MLPRHLLPSGRLGQRAQPGRKASVGRRQLVRSHRLSPIVACLPDRPHDLRALSVKIGLEAHGCCEAVTASSVSSPGSGTPTGSPPQKSSALGPVSPAPVPAPP